MIESEKCIYSNAISFWMTKGCLLVVSERNKYKQRQKNVRYFVQLCGNEMDKNQGSFNENKIDEDYPIDFSFVGRDIYFAALHSPVMNPAFHHQCVKMTVNFSFPHFADHHSSRDLVQRSVSKVIISMCSSSSSSPPPINPKKLILIARICVSRLFLPSLAAFPSS